MKRKMYNWAAGIMLAAALTLGACSDDDKELPKIDGYNNSNEVASENLVAHWTFDDTNAERLSGTEADDTYGDVNYTEGVIGEALDLNEGALVYPPIASINDEDALSNYTVSMWINVANTGDSFTNFFGIFPSDVSDVWGNLSLSAETATFPAGRPAGDTLTLKTNYVSVNEDGSLNNQDNRNDPRGTPPVGVLKASEQWVHFVVRFTASTHMLEIFANGTSIGAYNNRGDHTTELVMRTPAQVVFGTLAISELGFENAPQKPDWVALADAMIDDTRVYNTSLATTEITALYNLGLAGR